MSGVKRTPGVCIGMPVFNGAPYLRSTLDSLLQQSFGDFELIIADNASTDSTRAICDEYVSRDSRIRYIRHERNIGGPRNWNCLVGMARGELFKWASANDLHAPEFLERCVRALGEDDGAVLCYAETALIDERSVVTALYADAMDVSSTDPVDRFISLLLSIGLNNAQAGLIRTPVLRSTKLEGLYPGGDIPLMAELALRGRFIRLEDVLFSRRVCEGASTTSTTASEMAEFVDPGGNRRIRARWRCYRDLLEAPFRVSLTTAQRLRAVGHVMKMMYWDRRDGSRLP